MRDLPIAKPLLGNKALRMAQMLHLVGRGSKTLSPSHSTIGQTGVYLKKKTRWFKRISKSTPSGTRFQTKFGLCLPAFLLPWVENSLHFTSHLLPSHLCYEWHLQCLPTARTESSAKPMDGVIACLLAGGSRVGPNVKKVVLFALDLLEWDPQSLVCELCLILDSSGLCVRGLTS